MAHNVTLIPGDGIGPEVTEAARRALEATGVAFHWDMAAAGADVFRFNFSHGTRADKKRTYGYIRALEKRFRRWYNRVSLHLLSFRQQPQSCVD